MIGKVPKPGKGFKGLINYLLQGPVQDKKDKAQAVNRVAWTDVRNLATGNPALVLQVMRATAAKSRRCQSPVYHYVISWHRDENPTEAMMRQVADTTCEDLGLGDHQRLYIAHADTEHRHLIWTTPQAAWATTLPHILRAARRSLGIVMCAISPI